MNSNKTKFLWGIQAFCLAIGITLAAPASAIPLLTQADGTYGELAMPPNDDGSSNLLDLPFTVDFFGNTYNNFYINNNGNITFNAPVYEYTPIAFPASSNPMIAPYWGDVDTRCSTCGSVYVGSVNADTVIVTWNDVGYYSANPSLTNNFQLVIQNKAGETGTAGDFDVQFRYDRLEWTTGDASGGTGGLGGTPAQAGYDAGDGTNYFALPGSFTANVLNLQNTSNVDTSSPGLWSFAIRNGALPGETPDNPLMPVIADGSFQFDFNVDLNQAIYIDPVVAIGYDYEITSSNTFASVILPNIGDGLFDLWLYNSILGDYEDSGINISAGTEYFFGSGVDRFRIMGIETDAMLDPSDPTAFVTGLTFTSAGIVSMTMTPVTADTGGGSNTQVPEPSTLLLLGAGMMGLGLIKGRRKTHN